VEQGLGRSAHQRESKAGAADNSRAFNELDLPDQIEMDLRASYDLQAKR
jgi:hypothetical protein